MRSDLSLFLVRDCVFRDIAKKSFPNSPIFPCVFFPKSFDIFAPTFKSVLFFSVNFCVWYEVKVAPEPFVRKPSLPPPTPRRLCCTAAGHEQRDSLLGSPFCSVDLCICPYARNLALVHKQAVRRSHGLKMRGRGLAVHWEMPRSCLGLPRAGVPGSLQSLQPLPGGLL